MKSSIFKKCPVCEMELHNQSHMFSYLSIDYYFCSEQCSRAFEQHPHLYLGRPGGKKSIKKRGGQVIKTRKVQGLKKTTSLIDISTALTDVMGIKDLFYKKSCLYIKYDLIEVTWKEILACLESSKLLVKINLRLRFKYYFIDYIEENERSNLEDDINPGCH